MQALKPSSRTTMQSLAFSSFGGPEVLSLIERAVPTPGAGEVLVRVAAATINPTDLLMLSGQQVAMMTNLTPPYIAGMEFSGTVAEVGAGVHDIAAGQRVMGVVNPRRPAGGAHAQYLCVAASSVAPLADSVDLVQAATVPMNGLTCLAALQALDLRAGQKLLVTGGAGVVAGLAIQLAKARNITVVADAKEADVDHLRTLHVDHLVPRGDGLEAAVRLLYPEGVDGLLDTALLGDRVSGLVRSGGASVALRKSHPITDPRLRNSLVSVVEQMHDTASLRHLSEVLANGTLTTRIAERFPLSEGTQAMRLAEQGGLKGRVVLLC
jgi:NADPH2:quinone reductase